MLDKQIVNNMKRTIDLIIIALEELKKAIKQLIENKRE